MAGVKLIDVRHLGRERVIGCWWVDDVLVDPGPQSCEATLLEALDGERPRALLLTHIHFDHAGVAGALVRRWPDLPVYVHERGARHLADPERLVKSARRLYGDEFHRLWGDVVAVPEANLHVIGSEGESTLLDGAFRVAHTPGHASHHVSYLHAASGRAFVGDVGGVVIAPATFVVAPTPPPDVDVAAWERSLDLLAAWDPDSLGLTHFGAIDNARAQLEAVRRRLHDEIELTDGVDEETFAQRWRERLESEVDAATVEAYLQAVPPHHIVLGLARWREQQQEG
jgi:glyoxylase-like metal-dependent hydrolase (beta-lactamase superfamily II)